jgi:hypothetical protein
MMAISTFSWRFTALAAIATAAPLGAQQTLPGLDSYSLPPGQSTATPTPTPTPTPTVVPVVPVPVAPTIVLPAPTASASATNRRPPPPAPAETPETAPRGESPAAAQVDVSPPPTAVPAPEPRPTSSPTPVATKDTAAPADVERDQGFALWWIGGLAVLAAIALIASLRGRRSSRHEVETEMVESVAPMPAPPALSPVPVPVPDEPATRARLGLMLRPTRAGFNMLSATVEAELTVVNTGDAPAADIRIALVLLSAHAEQGAEIADHSTRPIARPAVPAFALLPGETRVARVVVALPRDSIRPLTAGNRPMFVPVVAANCRYSTDGTNGQAVQSFVIGIERDDAAKLAPFWLDQPARMYDRVAARPNATAPVG